MHNLRLAPLEQSNCGFCGFYGLKNTFGGGQSLSQPILICGSAPFVAGLGHVRGVRHVVNFEIETSSRNGLPAARVCYDVSNAERVPGMSVLLVACLSVKIEPSHQCTGNPLF